MIRLGKQITQVNDLMIDVSIKGVFDALRNGNGEVAKLQQKLKIIKTIDNSQYRRLKTSLPYLVCAQFSPKVRKKENFVYTEKFILDLDHLAENGFDIVSLKEKLKKDDQIELMFTSPSGDGLKLLFSLESKILDSSYYTNFYKSFCLKYAQINKLEAVIDFKTSDVSRCCFVSYDPTAYINLNPIKIKAEDYLKDYEWTKLEAVENEIKMVKDENSGFVLSNKNDEQMDDEIMNKVKARMGFNIKNRKQKEYEQPEELKKLMHELIELLETLDLRVTGNIPISYGRKITVKADKKWAEFNLFFGKRGVSVVSTTKTGSDKELCTLIVNLVKEQFNILH